MRPAMRPQDFQQFKTLGEYKDFLKSTGTPPSMAQKLVPLEKVYQKAIIEHLKTISGAFVWKEQSGAYQSAGLPDVMAVINGTLYGFEVKRPFFGAVSAIQSAQHDRLRAAGASVHVVTYVSEVKAILEG